MNLITPLLKPANVLADFETTSKKRLFEQAGQLFQASHGVSGTKSSTACFPGKSWGPPPWVMASPFPMAASSTWARRPAPSCA
jgi:hypothetical protein